MAAGDEFDLVILSAADYDSVIALWQQAGLHIRPAGRDSAEQFARQIEFLLGQEILVLDKTSGQRQPGHVAHPLRPQTSAIDKDVAANIAALHDHTDSAAPLNCDLLDAHALLDTRPMHAGALGVSHGQRIRIDIAVAWNERGAFDAIGDDIGETLLCFVGTERIALDAEALGLRHRAPDFAPAVFAAGKP